jgi:putative Mn2+ efflux pump MntP
MSVKKAMLGTYIYCMYQSWVTPIHIWLGHMHASFLGWTMLRWSLSGETLDQGGSGDLPL